MQRIPVGRDHFAMIDDEDLERVSKYKWRSGGNTYVSKAGHKTTYIYARAVHPKTKKVVHLSRLILNARKGRIVDHINGDTLDNRKANLRTCTIAQNIRNQKKHNGGKHSHYKGVTKMNGNWIAQIVFERRVNYLGKFGTEQDAARAYNEAAQKLYGRFARLNVVHDVPAVKQVRKSTSINQEQTTDK